MPTVGSFHGQYWEHSDTAVVVQPTHIGRGGYPAWQASVIAPSLFGMLGAWLDVRLAQAKWLYRFVRRLHALDPERRAVVLRVIDTVERPSFVTAQKAVRQTARTLGFNRPEAWKGLSRELKDSPGRAENTFRHLNACSLVKKEAVSTLTNPDLHLVVELAYQGFAWKGK